MARGATIMQFDVTLSDVDRAVYETLSVSAAQHPSESAEYLAARVLAYALEYQEGLTFTAGLSVGEEPALWVRDLTGQLHDWIEVGTPEGPRLHKASKAASRVAVYCHKEPSAWLRGLARERVHAAERIELLALPPAVLGSLAQGLERRNAWAISRIEGAIFVTAGPHNHEFVVPRLDWPPS